MNYLADRTRRIDASGIRKVFALAAQLENPINLSIGQPDFDVDDAVKAAAWEAIQAGKNGYTQTWGIEPLRQACVDYYRRKYDAPLENVMITSGVSGGLFLALMATVNPGDEVLFADPYFVMYKHLVNLLGGKPVGIDTYPDFKLRPDAIESVITERSKVLIVNSPSNPTGVTLTATEIYALAAVARRHNLLVISDEIYEGLHYDGAPATFAGRGDNVMVLNGFSKLAAMTGWRVGYAAGPEPIIQQMNTLQQYTFVCAPSFAQHAAVKALDQDAAAKVDAYRRKRDIIYEGLRERFNTTKPNGAFYIFPEAPGGDGEAFVKRAIDHNVLIIPGNVFSERNTHFRLSFAASNDTLERGVDVLLKLAEQYN
ncbi:MAG: pyridoxal phosphate-dependent aminotransferase [Candidatus Hydrogenedentales bacterium]